MAKKKQVYVVSENGNYRYRIFKSHDKKYVLVIRHKRDWGAPDVIVECVGDEQGRVFETQGDEVERVSVYEAR